MTNPVVKFESSPADSLVDSFVSTPGTQYDSLFPESTIDPSEAIMTPPFDADSSRAGSVIEDTPGPEKKAAKKRKSWGQQLPEPKTNLPPRKRAKTEDEKEQRRVERVLRNRRAAQSSRERKRLEVEALENEKKAIERRNKDLELRLADMEARNMLLQQQLAQITGNMTVFNQPSPPQAKPEPYLRAPSPITLSQELFSSRDSKPTTPFEQNSAEPSLNLQSSIQTVNPASISPEIRPVAESSLSNASSSDMTQHPAAMLCDLQCQSDEQRPWILTSPLPASQASPNQQASETISAMMLCLTMLSAATSTILSPLWQIINSLRTASSLSPTPSLLNSIIWLTTTPSSLSSTTSTSTTSSTPTTTSTPPRSFFTLRLTLLRRLLACSPQLARPLMDATMAVLRSASDRATGLGFEGEVSACGCKGADGLGRDRCKSCLKRKNNEPSIEALMTLLWATYVIDREYRQQQQREDTEKLNLFPTSTSVVEEQQKRSWRHILEEKSIKASSASSSCRRSWASTASRRSSGGRQHQQQRWE